MTRKPLTVDEEQRVYLHLVKDLIRTERRVPTKLEHSILRDAARQPMDDEERTIWADVLSGK